VVPATGVRDPACRAHGTACLSADRRPPPADEILSLTPPEGNARLQRGSSPPLRSVVHCCRGNCYLCRDTQAPPVTDCDRGVPVVSPAESNSSACHREPWSIVPLSPTAHTSDADVPQTPLRLTEKLTPLATLGNVPRVVEKQAMPPMMRLTPRRSS
jgi:hypothetical protein